MRSSRFAPKPPSDADPDKVVRIFQSETAEVLEWPEPPGVRATIYVAAVLIVGLVLIAAMTRLDRVIESVGVASQSQVEQINKELVKLSKKLDQLVGKKSTASKSAESR